MSGLRPIAAPFVVAAPGGARVRTRLRPSDADGVVLWAVGAHLGRLAGADLARRCSLGRGSKHTGRAERKQALTREASSPWAGAITRVSADQWERAMGNLVDERAGLRAAVATIEARLAAPTAGRSGGVNGYGSRAERWQKQRRLAHLRVRLTEVTDRVGAGRVSVCRGGRRLARARHHLDEVGLTEGQWAQRWAAERLFLHADGEADKRWGNETIRVHPDEGWIEFRLPEPLAQLSNTPGWAKTYRFDTQVRFNHRADEWAAQAASGAVAYTIWFDADRSRWYLDASWTTTTAAESSLDDLAEHRTLGVDLNADHLACWVTDPAGNPVGPALTVPLDLTGPHVSHSSQFT